MRLTSIAALALFSLLTTNGHSVRAETSKRVLIVPFDNRAGLSQNYLSIGLAAMLAEKLETEKTFKTLNGPLVLTKDQAVLFAGRDDLAAANALARSRGATHFVTGRYSGKAWEWTLIVEVYTVGDVPVLIGSGESGGSQMGPYKRKNGQTVQIVFMTNIQAMFAEAVGTAFANAGLPLSAATQAALADPPTADNWAFQNLARAYDRYFETGRFKTERTALEIAEYAVLVDPACAEAQRFYAFLLNAAGLPKKARIHYEAAVAKRPDDVRSLVALGRIEVEQGNYDAARVYLERAVKARPDDPEGHFRLAEAWLKLDDKDKAVSEFERARDLDGSDMETRRQLVTLYSDARRYNDASRELAVIVEREPGDLDAVFALGACLRAADRRNDAIAVYAKASERFPTVSRLHKFRGDLLRSVGNSDGASAAYEAALKLAPNDPRLKVRLGLKDPADPRSAAKSPIPPPNDYIGGDDLVDETIRGTRLMAEADSTRDRFRLAANDAVMEMNLRGKKACSESGAAPYSAALAAASGQEYRGIGRDLRRSAALIDLAIRNGEDAALTPDEKSRGRAIMASVKTAETDITEMRALYYRTLTPMARQYGCPNGPNVPLAEIADVRRRNDDRRVILPEVAPPRYALPIAPDIAPNRARTIHFAIDNRYGRSAYVLTLDSGKLGTVPAGQAMDFTASVGTHVLCLLPPDAECGRPGSLRQVFLHDGWTMIVKPAAEMPAGAF